MEACQAPVRHLGFLRDVWRLGQACMAWQWREQSPYLGTCVGGWVVGAWVVCVCVCLAPFAVPTRGTQGGFSSFLFGFPLKPPKRTLPKGKVHHMVFLYNHPPKRVPSKEDNPDVRDGAAIWPRCSSGPQRVLRLVACKAGGDRSELPQWWCGNWWFRV